MVIGRPADLGGARKRDRACGGGVATVARVEEAIEVPEVGARDGRLVLTPQIEVTVDLGQSMANEIRSATRRCA